MADASKEPLPGPASSIIPALDGSTDQPPTTSSQPGTLPAARSAPPNPQVPLDPDTTMTSPTRPTIQGIGPGAPLTPAASPRTSMAISKPTGPVPLDSTLRTTPIHPSLPGVKMPDSSPNTNPVTLQPFTDADLAKHGYEKLRAQIAAAAVRHGDVPPPPTGGIGEGGTKPPLHLSEREKEEIASLRDETAAALKIKIEEREVKVREIEREMEEKEKTRELERKLLRKKLAGGKEG